MLPPHRVPLLSVSLALALAACGDSAEEPHPANAGYARHLVLVSLDTVRADHLGCYGHARSETPTIDALADAGVLFREAMTAAPTTLASHSAILTGTPPHTHGVPRNGFVLHEANRTLAEVLAAEGFTTLGAIGAFPLSHEFGIAQGFQHYDDDLGDEESGAGYTERIAAEVTDAALAEVDAWFRAPAEGRLFLFVHYFDAHAPHTPPPPFDTRFREKDDPIPRTLRDGVTKAAARHYEVLAGGGGRKKRDWHVVGQGIPEEVYGKVDGRPLGIDRMLDRLYLGEIAYLDGELGRLFDGLEARGILRDAAVVLTADHGETMWEHEDFWNHGLGLYETTVHVPLIVRGPAGSPRVTVGGEARMPVSSIDIAPTALGLLGIAIPDVMEGVDLAPALRGTAFERGPIASEATMPFYVEEETSEPWVNAAKAQAIRDECYKLIRWNVVKRRALYDLSRDPGERTNLLGRKATPEAERVARRLAWKLEQFRAAARPLPTYYRADEDESVQEALDALGYSGESADEEE